MKKLLIISPRFPPINAPDMHRVRQSLPYFRRMGWEPEVWHVDANRVERDRDPLLCKTIPHDVEIRSVGALKPQWTRLVGLGSLALRSLPYYYWQVTHRLARGDIDLVYFSTTAFPVMILGRYWKRRFGIPYVIDMQDPWHTDYYLDQPPDERPPKFWFSYRLDKYLEPVAMKGVDGIISVSHEYCNTLCARYDNICPSMCEVIPFSASQIDFTVAQSEHIIQGVVESSSDLINLVYAGAISSSMKVAARAILGAVSQGRREHPELFLRVRLHFVGTSYAPPGEGKKSVMPIAEEYNLNGVVDEYPDRIPYFRALRLLRQADILVVPGSDEVAYTASKLATYILARRPLLAVFHERSSIVAVLHETKAGTAVTFDEGTSADVLADRVKDELETMLRRLPYTPDINWKAFTPFTAEAMTRRQVEVFNRVVNS